MGLITGPGTNVPPIQSPLTEITGRFGSANDQSSSLEQFTGFEWRIAQPWARWVAEVSRILAELTAGPTTAATYGADLTPAATVTPELELAAENGTFGILLNRATTTIAPATLNGAYPPDYYRFTIMLVNDGTDGRLKVWDPAYLGVSADDGSGAPDAINTFSFITLPAAAGFVLSTPYSTVEA